MQSFRTEEELQITNSKALVEKDILELGQKISAFKDGVISEDQFRALRLARGVYGQRQQGVQMIRIKLPFGKISTAQLRRIAKVSDEYSDGHIHLTTRQDVQIYHVSLDRTPELWAELEQDDITLREACGNTVRNITASPFAGILKDELFDVSPYADAMFRYFLRKPFGQELGRKIKMAFSATDQDDALTFIHDIGFIPRIENGRKGFKVVIGGGLGAQPFFAQTAHEFLPVEEIIPFAEAVIRVFDRLGERNNRNKARLKYVIAKIGLDSFLDEVEAEQPAVQFDASFLETITEQIVDFQLLESIDFKSYYKKHDGAFQRWLDLNVQPQKQAGYFAVGLKIPLGNLSSNDFRSLACLFDELQLSDLRITIQQGILVRFVPLLALFPLYTALSELGIGNPGVNSIADVTACPGTETCNLAISSSTHVALAIEEHLYSNYPELLTQSEIRIKISGCMNSCGQHGIAQIGLHGSSQKVNGLTMPALQLLLGGGRNADGSGRISEKVIKFPSKRVLTILSALLDDYLDHNNNEIFNDYYDRRGNKYFYDLLKPIADTTEVSDVEFIDWGSDEQFKTAIGVGECAGVVIDLIGSLFYDVQEKLSKAKEAIHFQSWADATYHAYSAGIVAAKAYLLKKGVRCNTQIGIIHDLDAQGETWKSLTDQNFESSLLRIRQEKATETFSTDYVRIIESFVTEVQQKIKDNEHN